MYSTYIYMCKDIVCIYIYIYIYICIAICIYVYTHINCRALTVFVSTMIPLGQGFELPSTTDVSINRKICKLEHFLSWESTMCESQLFDPPHACLLLRKVHYAEDRSLGNLGIPSDLCSAYLLLHHEPR